VRDEPLEDGFARREAGAYETAYRSFGARMYTAALRLSGDAELARECVQDVFLHLWRRRTAYVSARGSLEAFLVACARNAALTRLRSTQRRGETAAKVDLAAEYVLENDPIERERIARAVSRLSEGQADVVQLAYYRGFTLNEVAADLQIPVGTVKGRLSAALRALRRSLVLERGNDG